MDPLWAQVGVTAVLVGVTIYYAYQVRKSNESVWDLEKNRRKHEKEKEEVRKSEEMERLRNLLAIELGHNLARLDALLSFISTLKEDPKLLQPVHDPPLDIVYRAILDKLGVFPPTEIFTIVEIYSSLYFIGRRYKEITEIIKNYNISPDDTQALKLLKKARYKNIIQTLNLLEKTILRKMKRSCIKFYDDKDVLKFEKNIRKLWDLSYHEVDTNNWES